MSYFYIINPQAGGGIYRKTALKLKELLLELGISGEMVVATHDDDFTKLAHLGLKRGFSNIIAIGGGETINAVALAVIQAQKGVFGFIPMGKQNVFAQAMGIPDWKYAAHILAARRINRVDIGCVGSQIFLTALEISKNPTKINFNQSSAKLDLSGKPFDCSLTIDAKYLVEAKTSRLIISNLAFGEYSKYSLFNGKFEVIFSGEETKFKLFGSQKNPLTELLATKIDISPTEQIPIWIDGTQAGITPCQVEIVPAALRMIVDRDRPLDSK